MKVIIGCEHSGVVREAFRRRGQPRLVATEPVAPRWVCCKRVVPHEHACDCGKKALPRWANQTDSGQNRLGPSEDRWKLRSKTYEGIANAMVAQWGFLPT